MKDKDLITNQISRELQELAATVVTKLLWANFSLKHPEKVIEFLKEDYSALAGQSVTLEQIADNTKKREEFVASQYDTDKLTEILLKDFHSIMEVNLDGRL